MMEWLHILAASLREESLACTQISDMLKENGFEQEGELVKRLHPLPAQVASLLLMQQELLAQADSNKSVTDFAYIEGQIFAYSQVLSLVNEELYESFSAVLHRLRVLRADEVLGEMVFDQDDGSFIERLSMWTDDVDFEPNVYRTSVQFRIEDRIHRARVHVDFFEGSAKVYDYDWQLEES